MNTFKNIRLIPNGGAYISGLIQTAVNSGAYTCTVSGNWEIEQTVRIPSGFTLVLDGCYLRMKDGTMCNMFVNEHLGCENNTVTDYDICIEGRGRAILDGGEPNGLNEKTYKETPEAFPHISVNNLILFVNVDGFRIHGLHLCNQRWWAMDFLYCRRGVLRDLSFRSDYTRIDENGNRVEKLYRNKYAETYVKNSDGIDLRCGCHDIIIENITGFTEDDTIAMTGLQGSLEKRFCVEGMDTDICNILIRNVNSTAYCSNVRLLCGDGIKVHDILVDGVFDSSKDCREADGGVYAVKIGDRHPYGTAAQPGDMYNITIKNVHGRSAEPIHLACPVNSLHLEDIYHI